MIEIRVASMIDLSEYEQVSIARTITGHINRRELQISNGRSLAIDPVNPYIKDYDDCEKDRPSVLPQRFDAEHWGTVVALQDSQRIGGAILAWKSRRFDLLEGRDDLVHIVDLRVAPEARGQGIGRALFRAAIAWAKERNSIELRVETQDTNPEACRFYAAMGCHLHSWEEGAYGPEIDELKLIWAINIAD